MNSFYPLFLWGCDLVFGVLLHYLKCMLKLFNHFDAKISFLSFQDSIGNSHLKSILDMAGVVPMNNAAFSNRSGFAFGGKLICSRNRHNRLVISSAKTSETVPANLNGQLLFFQLCQFASDLYEVNSFFVPLNHLLFVYLSLICFLP